MKAWRKFTALVLSVACVCALVCVPPAGAAEAVSTFPDITDAQVGRAVEALRTMGVIDGSGGLYHPNNNLTRAQFCKMALLTMGKGSEADAQANRTIFTDVPGSHWARGYVNLAAITTVGGTAEEGGTRLMMGLGNGCFAPDRPITYGEAVTAILRILGYVKEANSNWPRGAVSTAASVGLTAGFTPPDAGAKINRAQAALLFCNMLTTPVSGSKDKTYLESLSYTVKKGALLLDCNASLNGTSGYVKVFTKSGDQNQDTVLPAVRTPASSLVGTRGTAVYDQQGKLLTFLPDAASTSRTITVASASGGVLTATDGTKYTPSSKTNVWNGGSSPLEYAQARTSLQAGTSLTICFTEAGAIDYLFVHGTKMSLSGGVMVARDKVSGNPFAQLTAGTVDYKIVKNGAEVSTSALQQYDVAAFDPTNKTLYVTNFRLTGVYESASPNTTMPTKIKLSLLDKELDVLDSAVDDLKGLKLNSTVTLLFSPDGKVAGAVSSSTLRSNTVGYVTASTSGSEDSAGSVTVKLLNAPRTDSSGPDLSEIKGNFSGNADNYADCLVRVTGTANSISLSRLSGRTPSGVLNVARRTLGDAALAENVAVFDRIANSAIKSVSLSDVSMASVPASKIAYQRTDAAGKVDLLVLDNVTGDLYTYGIARVADEETGKGLTVPKRDSEGNIVYKKLDKGTNTVDKDGYALDDKGHKIPIYEKGTQPYTQLGDSFIDANNRPVDEDGYLLQEGPDGTLKKVPLIVGNDYVYKKAVDEDGYALDDNNNKIPVMETLPTINKITTVTNTKTTVITVGGTTYRSNQFIGITVSKTATQIEGYSRPAASVALKSVAKVSPSNFNLNTGIFFSGSVELPIWDQVECYNAQTGKWFGENSKDALPMDNLRACLAYSENLTVYYDRDPAQGGKVRVVVAN